MYPKIAKLFEIVFMYHTIPHDDESHTQHRLGQVGQRKPLLWKEVYLHSAASPGPLIARAGR